MSTMYMGSVRSRWRMNISTVEGTNGSLIRLSKLPVLSYIRYVHT